MADTTSPHQTGLPGSPDKGIMNETAHDTLTTSPTDPDTCRICRAEATPTEPLFYPCKCSGSIKYVHQQCLMEWLSRSNKKHCELCKTPFRFTKLYAAQMPAALPVTVFLRRAVWDMCKSTLTWLRAGLVFTVWVLVMPWCIRWAWRGLFWLADAGWARKGFIEKILEPVVAQTGRSVVVARSAMFNESDNDTLTRMEAEEATLPDRAFEAARAALSFVMPSSLGATEAKPNATVAPVHPDLRHGYPSLFATFPSLANVTSSSRFNRIFLDMLEGQCITVAVFVAFILVFLIREWVIQQQPIIQAAANVENQVNREIRANRANRANRENRANRANQVEHRNQVEQANQAHENNEANERNEEVQHADAERLEAAEPAAGLVVQDRDSQPLDRSMFEDESESSDAPHSPEEGERATEWQGQPSQTDPARIGDISTDAHSVGSVNSAESWQHLSDAEKSDPEREDTRRHNEVVETAERRRKGKERATEPADEDLTPTNASHSVISSEGIASGSADNAERPESPIPQSSNPFRLDYDSTRDFEPAVYAPADEDDDVAVPDGEEDNDEEDNDEEYMDATDLPAGQHAQGVEELIEQHVPPAQERQHQRPPRGFLDAILDLFWGNIVVHVHRGEEPPLAQFDERRVQNIMDEAPFVAFVDAQPARNAPDHGPPDPEAGPARDPDVRAAAAEAGLDPEMIEEAEDLEGIMELVGMQGPLIGLFQTSGFCYVLIAATLSIAVGGAYLWGKVVLLFVDNPVFFFVKLPLRLANALVDFCLDFALLLLGNLAYWTVTVPIVCWKLISAQHPLRTPYFLQGVSEVVLPTQRVSRSTAVAAGHRLMRMFAFDHFDHLDSGPLQVSLQAHASLHNLQAEVMDWLGTFRETCTTVYTSVPHWTPEYARSVVLPAIGLQARHYAHSLMAEYKEPVLQAVTALKSGSFTFAVGLPRKGQVIDPELAYWSPKDIAVTICVGYVCSAILGAVYLSTSKIFSTSETGQRLERLYTDSLKQAGGVLKVIFIISIEMIVFPLYCGFLLDCALLPLFEDASFTSRLVYTLHSPWTSGFVHWFIGTCYMFHFALFVSMCRKIMRSGVLYFIRDPDDPTFHPVRDVLERNVTTQLRKIAFSAVVYGALVIVCLGSVVWSIDRTFPGVFPVHWTSPEAVIELPVDLLLYNFLTPMLLKLANPSDGLHAVYKWWFKRCARFLRLSHFLFGDRRRDEEGRFVRNPAMDGGPAQMLAVGVDERLPANAYGPRFAFEPSGRYVRAPASDQVRIPRGGEVFLEVNEGDERLNGRTDMANGIHGSGNEQFTMVYVPPWFRVRIGLFIVSLWLFAAATGLCVTVVPLVFGRRLFSIIIPERVRMNDIYAFTFGIHSLGGVGWCVLRGPTQLAGIGALLPTASLTTAMRQTKHYTLRICKLVYVYGFAGIVLPLFFAAVFELYLIMPLYTYIVIHTNEDPSHESAPDLSPMTHHMHLLRDWTLGLIYLRIALRLILSNPVNRPAIALLAIVREGYLNPDSRLATRAFILPLTLLFALLALVPPASVRFALLVSRGAAPATASAVLLFRYAYVAFAAAVLAVLAVVQAARAARRWEGRIRDDVYLLGERLHNFGERRVGVGS
ncbi:hypothetical protein LTR50_004022 [Elasticomyces elasticus]|nr:hypothetical protein LTR50_004022 [Elasticomyces elasticus]